MPETNPSDDIIELTDIVEEDGSPVAGPGSGDAGADMSFERELEDLFSDAGPASPPAAAKSPPPPADDISLELEEMELPGMDSDAPAAQAAPDRPSLSDDDDMDVIDLSDLVEDEPDDEALAQAPATPAADDLSDVADVADIADLGDLDGIAAMDAELELPAPPESGAGDDDVLPDLTGLGLEEDASLAGMAPEASPEISQAAAVATAAAATGAAAAAVSAASPPLPDEGIDLEALDAIIAKAGGPPPVQDEAEAKAAADLLESAVARIAVLEDRMSALEAEVSGVTGQAARQEAAQASLADALRTEFSTLVEERLAAFGGELAEKAPAPVDVSPALAALSSELKAYMEERLESFPDQEAVAAAGEALGRELRGGIERRSAEATATVEAAVAGLRDEISSLRDAVAALQDEHAAAAAPAPGADDLDALRREAADLAKAVEALREDVACRVTKVDQDALVTRIRMDLAAEIQAGIEKTVPAEAARIIREEIAALAREMDD